MYVLYVCVCVSHWYCCCLPMKVPTMTLSHHFYVLLSSFCLSYVLLLNAIRSHSHSAVDNNSTIQSFEHSTIQPFSQSSFDRTHSVINELLCDCICVCGGICIGVWQFYNQYVFASMCSFAHSFLLISIFISILIRHGWIYRNLHKAFNLTVRHLPCRFIN